MGLLRSQKSLWHEIWPRLPCPQSGTTNVFQDPHGGQWFLENLTIMLLHIGLKPSLSQSSAELSWFTVINRLIPKKGTLGIMTIQPDIHQWAEIKVKSLPIASYRSIWSLAINILMKLEINFNCNNHSYVTVHSYNQLDTQQVNSWHYDNNICYSTVGWDKGQVRAKSQ